MRIYACRLKVADYGKGMVIKMKKILVILTGGTIGSRVEGSTIDVTESSAYELITRYKHSYGDKDTFEVLQVMTILSENMRPEIWTKLVAALWNIAWKDYQGVIITHGSDTLAYTSALIGMLFAHVPVPVVLTAGNYPLSDKRSNGLANFRNSVELIKVQGIRGVFTVYQNPMGENCVYLATRITEADCYQDSFGAFGGSVFGYMAEGELKVCDAPVNPTISQLCEFCEGRGKLTENPPVFQKQIWMIRPYPGLNYNGMDLSQRPKAILHYLYHSATACTEGEEYSFLRFLKKCSEKGISVYGASYKEVGGVSYITGDAVLKTGIKPMCNISPEAAYMKLMLAYHVTESGTEEEIDGMMERNLYYEHLPALC